MENRKMNRSFAIAAVAAVAGAGALSLGLFLAVGKDSLAEEKSKQKVKVVTVAPDAGGDDDVVSVETGEGDSEGSGFAFSTGSDEARGYLGVSLREDTKSDEGGALVEHVIDDSPAAKAGLKKNDVIVNFAGAVVRGPARVTEKLRDSKPGDKVAVDVRRDGHIQKLTVELGKRSATVWSFSGDSFAPMNEEQRKALDESLRGLDEKKLDLQRLRGTMKLYTPGRHGVFVFGRNKPLLGIEMVEATPDLRESMGGSKEAGVIVGKVLPGTAADKAGLKVGDLILSIEGEKVAGPGELSDAINKYEGKTVDIDLVRDKRTMHLKAVLPKIDEPEDEPTGPRASLWRMEIPAPPALPSCAAPRAPMAAPAAPPTPPAPPAPPALLPRLIASTLV